MVDELIRSDIKIEAVYALSDWILENNEKYTELESIIERINNKELEQISNLSTPNQVVTVCQIPERDVKAAENERTILALDGIRDPGNLGTIIRTADWFGLKSILCSNDCVDVFNSKVVQATMGSIFRVKVYYTDLNSYLEASSKNIYATVMDGESIFDTHPDEGVYVIGNESNGIRPEVLKHATHRISIPAQGGAESLNAAVATGVVLALAKNN